MKARKIMVVSDSHGNTDNVIKAIDKEKDIDLFIHLGDVIRDVQTIKSHLKCSSYFVAGNCDYDPELPKACKVYIGDRTGNVWTYSYSGYQRRGMFWSYRDKSRQHFPAKNF